MRHFKTSLGIASALLLAHAAIADTPTPKEELNPLTLLSVHTDKPVYEAGAIGVVELEVESKAGFDYPQAISVLFTKPTEQNPAKFMQKFGFDHARIDKACTQRCTMRIPFAVPDYVESGTWTLDNLLVSSENWHEKVTLPSEVFNFLAIRNAGDKFYANYEHNAVNEIPVVRIEVTGTHPDTTPPKLLSIRTDQKTYKRSGRILVTIRASDEGGSGVEDRSPGLVNDGAMLIAAIQKHGSKEKGVLNDDTYIIGTSGGPYEVSGDTHTFYMSRFIHPQILKQPGVYDQLIARACDRAGNCSGFRVQSPEELKALPEALNFSVTITE